MMPRRKPPVDDPVRAAVWIGVVLLAVSVWAAVALLVVGCISG